MSTKSPKRVIRSYVRREGRITPAQLRALEELLPRYGIPLPPAELDFDRVFGRIAPRIIEIGFGNGETLLSMAAEHPEIDYLGIEVHRPGVGHLLLELERAGLGNIRIACADALEVLRCQVSDASLAAVNVFFPDPWPKKRHHKRRLVKPSFLELVAAKLNAGGRLHLATDWQNYAEHMAEIAHSSPWFTIAQPTGPAIGRPVTKFERRGQQLGHQTWDLILVRKTGCYLD